MEKFTAIYNDLTTIFMLFRRNAGICTVQGMANLHNFISGQVKELPQSIIVSDISAQKPETRITQIQNFIQLIKDVCSKHSIGVTVYWKATHPDNPYVFCVIYLTKEFYLADFAFNRSGSQYIQSYIYFDFEGIHIPRKDKETLENL